MHIAEADTLAADLGSLRAGGERARRRVKWDGDGYLPWACRYFPRLCLRALGFGKRAGASGRRAGRAVLIVGSILVFGLVAERHHRSALLAHRVDDAGRPAWNHARHKTPHAGVRTYPHKKCPSCTLAHRKASVRLARARTPFGSARSHTVWQVFFFIHGSSYTSMYEKKQSFGVYF